MHTTAYERIGRTYAATRRPDPRIATEIRRALGDARSVVNIGAGTGSYEPDDLDVVAVDPSQTMLDQRPPGAAPAMLGRAEQLPLDDQSVDAALAVLTVHHWSAIPRAWAEIRRVARRRAVFLTADPLSAPFWLVRDYLPEILALDVPRLPAMSRFAELGPATVDVLEIPHDCVDGFLAAFWRRPSAYLDPAVRANISGFAQLPHAVVARGIAELARDLADGTWLSTNAELLDLPTLDVGYRIVTCSFGSMAP